MVTPRPRLFINGRKKDSDEEDQMLNKLCLNIKKLAI